MAWHAGMALQIVGNHVVDEAVLADPLDLLATLHAHVQTRSHAIE